MNVISVLHAEYRRQRAIPFAWGEADCLTWAADCTKAIMGRDPIKGLRGRYKSERGAKRVMVTEGWADMGDVAAAHAREIPLAFAQSGDWATVRNPDGTDTIGVVVAHQIALRSVTGLGHLPLAHAERAFRL